MTTIAITDIEHVIIVEELGVAQWVELVQLGEMMSKSQVLSLWGLEKGDETVERIMPSSGVWMEERYNDITDRPSNGPLILSGPQTSHTVTQTQDSKYTKATSVLDSLEEETLTKLRTTLDDNIMDLSLDVVNNEADPIRTLTKDIFICPHCYRTNNYGSYWCVDCKTHTWDPTNPHTQTVRTHSSSIISTGVSQQNHTHLLSTTSPTLNMTEKDAAIKPHPLMTASLPQSILSNYHKSSKEDTIQSTHTCTCTSKDMYSNTYTCTGLSTCKCINSSSIIPFHKDNNRMLPLTFKRRWNTSSGFYMWQKPSTLHKPNNKNSRTSPNHQRSLFNSQDMPPATNSSCLDDITITTMSAVLSPVYSLLDLPDEILLIILSYLSPAELITCTLVNTRLYQLTSDSSLTGKLLYYIKQYISLLVLKCMEAQ